MKILLVSLLGLCTVLSVQAEQPCDGSVNCTCDPSLFTAATTPPNPDVTCPNGQMIIYISKCQLEKSLFNSTSLSLDEYTGDECASKEYYAPGNVLVGFHNPLSSTKCGNKYTVNSTHVTYSNNLHIYPAIRTIITRNNFNESLSCSYLLNYPVKLNITLKPVIKNESITVPGVDGKVDLVMAAYSDSQFSIPITENTDLFVEDTIYIQVFMPLLEAGTFSIKVIRLFAVPGGVSPDVGPVFNLTSGNDGCPDPEYGSLINIIQNGNGSISRFAMKVFKITDYPLVDLYAVITICPTVCPSQCTEKTAKVYVPDNVATMSLQFAAGGSVYSGASDRLSLSWTLVSLISTLLFVKLM